jgi:hypothetical protein
MVRNTVTRVQFGIGSRANIPPSRDEAGVVKQLGIFDADGQSALDFGLGLGIVAGCRQRPGMRVEGEDVMAARKFLLSEVQGLGGLFGIVGVVGDELVIGVVGERGLGERLLLENGEGRIGFAMASGAFQRSANA